MYKIDEKDHSETTYALERKGGTQSTVKSTKVNKENGSSSKKYVSSRKKVCNLMQFSYPDYLRSILYKHNHTFMVRRKFSLD